ncbi:flavin-dependent dehydrogenase [Clostridium tetanomorphum]|uniref:NAD(P)/FAD-dependent oxidoreductase n=1 Tax=Clostridium tetanomorphum TaxID=1553 RepID=A0A923J0R1_CLOTT|nr:dehydrogenase [Clostridium tetanomorphum]KAJ49460.1 FAD-dependent dehydrogenase [Clostridium tetanomorphum DSM 665]KAJ51069.1 FAD-dependent dehydrogenase [Clostridium tetanomorphum DSM 665]MBC2397989.1 NAD(P)/FAD-dependent oxidoreductase [Clostridium tetanomorphum]MBP1864505.1 flavin-dependent dehydrogenase [Clostridium tetanomorphum]NRS82964.1 flavin-dependent dehydrogenase [Clostridium tetanomorphum]
MKVAIMGAGLSGLSCAITLEKNGIKPMIFEDRLTVGDRFVNCEAIFNILNRPINNCLSYIDNKYEIHLNPISHVKKMIFYSKNEVGTIEGNLGTTNIRGRHKDSFENQLFNQVKSEINFNSKYSYEDLKKEFTHIVLATGDGEYACRLNNYECDVPVNLKGATVEGNFEANVTSAWFNYDFLPKGYAYLIPFSAKEAHIVAAYPNYPENSNINSDKMWGNFYSEASKHLKQDLRITDRFQVKDYIIGICKYPKLNNTYFVGNCFGAISPALGFGQFIAILTGIYAAYDICGLGDYNILTKPLMNNYKNSLVLRRTIEKFTNDNFDMLFKALDNKLLDKIIDKLYGDETNIDLIKWLSYIIRPWINL